MSSRRTIDQSHQWTTFEKNAVLALFVKGYHLAPAGRQNKKDDEGQRTQSAYLTFATELNKALSGETGYESDIKKIEITKFVDKCLAEQKNVVGKGGMMERSKARKITRGLRMMWQREQKFDFDGTIGEWNAWRKESKVEKLRIANGGLPKVLPKVLPTTSTDPANTETTNPWAVADLIASTNPSTNWTAPIRPISAPRATALPTLSYEHDGQLRSAVESETRVGAKQSPQVKYANLKAAHKYPINRGGTK